MPQEVAEMATRNAGHTAPIKRPKPQSAVAFGDYTERLFSTPSAKAELSAEVERIHAIADVLATLDSVREDAGVSKAHIGRRLKTPASVVSRLFKGEGSNPTLDRVLEISQAMGLRATIHFERRRKDEKLLKVRAPA